MALKKIFLVAVMVYLVAAEEELQKTPTLQVEAGTLRGVVKPDGLRGYYHAYMGIPYATASNRFQAATPVKPWDDIFEANDDSIRCAQVDLTPFYLIQTATDVVTQEDCLTLNVYTPLPQPGSALKPVMVFIYGGGLLLGSASSRIYGPEYLLRNDVIIVTLNYRLDIFGNLCLGIPEAPGNIGFKDQVEALRWVKKNIQAFGGDPDNVTIFGQSVGAGSAMLHVVSPMSQGLFHKVIAQSGTSIAPWSLEIEPLKLASEIASVMGYSTQDPKELYNIFTNKTTVELLSSRAPRRQGDTVFGLLVYGGCVEPEFEGVERFLPDLPYNLLVSGQYAKVPIVLGHNSNEGNFLISSDPPAVYNNITIYDSLPKDLVFPSEQEARSLAAELEKLYLNNAPISKDTVFQISNYVGDSQFTYPVMATADILIKTNDQPVFLYNFSYSGLLNFAKYQAGPEAIPGATHADDIFYLFKHSLESVNELIEATMILKMTTMWTNFAKFSDPIPEETALLPLKWQPLTKVNQNEFAIGTTFSTNPMYNTKELQFWREVYAKYRSASASSTERKNLLENLDEAILSPILEPVGKLGEDVLTPILEPVGKLGEAVLTPVAKLGEDVLTPILEPVGKLGEAVLTPVEKLGEAVLTPVEKLGEAVLTPILEPVGKLGEAVLTPVEKLGEAVLTPILEPVGKILG